MFFIFLLKYIALTLFFCPKSWTLTGKEAEALHLEEEDDEDHEEEKDPIQKMLKSKLTNQIQTKIRYKHKISANPTLIWLKVGAVGKG